MNYFKGLSKEEQKNIKKEFLEKDECIIYKKINRIAVLSYVGVIFSVIASVYDVLYKSGLFSYILDGLLFIFSLLFIIKTNKMKSTEINKYALLKKGQKKTTKK